MMENTLRAVVSAVGGESNIMRCGNCMTRLRLTLKDNDVADQEKVKAIPGVFGVIEAQQQFQVVLGPGKADKAALLMNQLYSFK